jgi:PAS domain-containing protein
MGSQFAATRRRGRIVFNNRRSSVDCFVCGLSPFGATLEVTDARLLPARFDLLVEGEATARAATVHDVGNERLGVVFAAATPGEKAAFGRKQPPAGEVAQLASNDFLQNAEFGLVMVDRDMRAILVNKVFRQLWKLSDALSESSPPLAELLRNGPIATAPTATVADIVSRAKLGDSKPVDIRMTGDDVLRFHCITLPGGRRLLTFTNVTDFAQRIDELEVLRGAIDNVDQGIVILDRDLRVRFVNKKARELWRLKPEQCDHWPSFAHFLYDIAATGVYDVPEDKLEDYVLMRYTAVQSGNPRPVDIRIKGGRIIRAQCTALPCDGRMLTHTDVTDLAQRADFMEPPSISDPPEPRTVN